MTTQLPTQPMMTCRTCRPLLADYTRRRLPLTTRRAIGAHLDTCPDCRRALDSVRGIVQALEQNTSAIQMSGGTMKAIWGGVLDDLHAPIDDDSRRLRLRHGMIAAALFVLFMLPGALQDVRVAIPTPPTPKVAAVVSTPPTSARSGRGMASARITATPGFAANYAPDPLLTNAP